MSYLLLTTAAIPHASENPSCSISGCGATAVVARGRSVVQRGNESNFSLKDTSSQVYKLDTSTVWIYSI